MKSMNCSDSFVWHYSTPLLFPSADFPAFTFQSCVLESAMECKMHFTSEG